MSTHDVDLRSALKPELEAHELRDAGCADAVFDRLSKAFPISGSKIDWKRVSGAIEEFEENESLQCARFLMFFDEMLARFNLKGPVIYVGDSATERAIEGTVDAMRRVLPKLVEVPQHHYLIGPDCSWCLCMTFEGDMAFGFSNLSSDAR